MDNMKQDSRYEELYTQLLERGLDMHINNKKRIKVGLIILVLLPVVLGIIRRLTDSNKIVFLIIWVFCMFALCIYLITIEYIDDSIQKTLEEVTDREAVFDDLFHAIPSMSDWNIIDVSSDDEDDCLYEEEDE